jgi:tetratricopeptide (TPR) repeat protein
MQNKRSLEAARSLQRQGRTSEAERMYRELLCDQPDSIAVLEGLAALLVEQSRVGEAAPLFARVAAIRLNSSVSSGSLAGQSQRDGRSVEFSETTGIPSNRESAESCFKQGVAHLREARHAQAEASFREAVRIDPSFATPWVGLSQVQAERGEIDDSCASARSAIALCPVLSEAHWRLATTLRGRLPDVEVRAIERLLGDGSMPDGALAFLHFGMAAVLDDRGLFSEAADNLDTAHRLQARVRAAQGRSHDPDAEYRFTETLVATFNAGLFARARDWVKPDTRPVFVVGLQRSGTTLVEQILASHPQIHGAGELRDVGQIFEALPQIVGPPSRDSFDALNWLSAISANAAAGRYLDKLAALAPATALRVVDKSPDNIRFLGLIAVLWPGARVIICDRDLRDVAISCWQTGYAFRWSGNWDHIARRFAIYQRILDHWTETRPLDWLDMRYEDLIDDLEGQARRMIDFVGLEWNSACVRFHSTKRVVRTPSLAQVRQPIHAQSVGRWRNYEVALAPFFSALERHGIKLTREFADRRSR